MKISDVTDVYNYDKNTGLFSWKESSRKGVRKNHIGSAQNGYLRLRVNKVYYCAHWLVWLIEKGSLPTKQIDHINGIKNDNRIINLREVDPILNSQNQRKAHKTNKCGLLGVSPSYGSWKAQIKVNKKSIHIGQFKTPQLAHEAYINAKRLYQPGCTI